MNQRLERAEKARLQMKAEFERDLLYKTEMRRLKEEDALKAKER